MSNLNHIETILNNLQPMEILEMVNLDCEPQELVYALADHIEENLETIEGLLIQAGLINKGE